MEKIEIKAKILNLASLFFCGSAVFMSLNKFFSVVLIFLALLQFIHILFGDVTDSYRLLRKKRFMQIYKPSLIIFSFLTTLAVIILDSRWKIYFIISLFAFILDFQANKMRLKRLDKKKSKR
ncbi:MAG: hypothetical protein V1660_01680 [archaeon]